MGLCLYSCFCYSQVYKFKAFESTVIANGDDSPIKWKECDILTVINITKNKIQIYAKHNVDLDLISKGGFEKDAEQNIHVTYKAVDEGGVRCTIELVIFDNQDGRHKATLSLQYSDAHIVYRLKNTDE